MTLFLHGISVTCTYSSKCSIHKEFRDVLNLRIYIHILCTTHENPCNTHIRHFSKVVVEWLSLLLRIREIQSSNLDQEAACSEKFLRGFPQFLHKIAGTVP
jgi:hypothetical protein